MDERWSKRIWTAVGTWRYSNMQPSSHDETVSRNYQHNPTPEEVRSDLQNDVINNYGHHATIDRVVVCEVLTTHLFDA